MHSQLCQLHTIQLLSYTTTAWQLTRGPLKPTISIYSYNSRGTGKVIYCYSYDIILAMQLRSQHAYNQLYSIDQPPAIHVDSHILVAITTVPDNICVTMTQTVVSIIEAYDCISLLAIQLRYLLNNCIAIDSCLASVSDSLNPPATIYQYSYSYRLYECITESIIISHRIPLCNC